MFSSRIPIGSTENRLAQLRTRLDASGVDVVDLTESNPTRVGLAYPSDLLASLNDQRALVYEPLPLGLTEARVAVAGYLSGKHQALDPNKVVLTASTSEAYSCLFKVLCDPGERVLVPQPSYPLLEHLARFEGVEPTPYSLVYHGRWEIDLDSLRTGMKQGVRAVVVVSPNNPTGSFLSPGDHQAVQELCRDRGCALIVDEVFGRYPLDETVPTHSVLGGTSAVLTFCLGGLSKAVGLPQAKLGWIVVDGTDPDVKSALAALELVLDTYLSVSTPVQIAASQLLSEGAAVTRQIRQRVADNHNMLVRLAAAYPSTRLLRVEGGWYAVIQVPAVAAEEQLVLDLLEDDHIRVHPGYFFDFPREAFLVMSLLLPPDRFAPAVRRVFARATNYA